MGLPTFIIRRGSRGGFEIVAGRRDELGHLPDLPEFLLPELLRVTHHAPPGFDFRLALEGRLPGRKFRGLGGIAPGSLFFDWGLILAACPCERKSLTKSSDYPLFSEPAPNRFGPINETQALSIQKLGIFRLSLYL